VKIMPDLQRDPLEDPLRDALRDANVLTEVLRRMVLRVDKYERELRAAKAEIAVLRTQVRELEAGNAELTEFGDSMVQVANKLADHLHEGRRREGAL